jgi:hypothetical protein
MPKRTGGVGEQRREPLHPPVHRHVVDIDAARGQQLLDVPIREPVPGYERTATVITSDGNRKRGNAERSTLGRAVEVAVTTQWRHVKSGVFLLGAA